MESYIKKKWTKINRLFRKCVRHTATVTAPKRDQVYDYWMIALKDDHTMNEMKSKPEVKS